MARAASAARPARGDQADSPGPFGGRADRQQAALARFEREAQATASLRSPHTVELLRLRHLRRRHVLLRDGAARRARPRRWLQLRAAARGARRSISSGRSATRSREAHAARTRPSRHQAGEHVRLPGTAGTVDFVKVLDFGLAKNRRAAGRGRVGRTAERTAGTPPTWPPKPSWADRRSIAAPISTRSAASRIIC